MNNPVDEKKDIEDEEDTVVTKHIALIRHGQALHNVNSENWYTPDNPLTKYGESQLKRLREKLTKQYKKAFYDKIDVVITSPLLRALQTTLILFSGMNIPIYVSVHHTECFSAECDFGTNVDVLLKKFPIFKAFKGWDDISNENWWPIEEETREKLFERHISFADLLIKHDKKCIAAVGHGAFFKAFTKQFGKERMFNNGEINWYKFKYEKKNYLLKQTFRISPPK
eukprot:272806_1